MIEEKTVLNLREIIKPHHITSLKYLISKARREKLSRSEQKKKFNTFGIFSVEYCTTSRQCERAPCFPIHFSLLHQEKGDKGLQIARSLLRKLSKAQTSVIPLIVAGVAGLKICPGHCIPYLYLYSYIGDALPN